MMPDTENAAHPFSVVVVGLISGLRVVIGTISFGAMIFTGALQSHTAAGVGIALSSAVLIGIIMTLGSSHRGTVGIINDKATAILAVVAGTIATQGNPVHGSPETVFATIVGVLMVSSAVVGVLFLLLGVLKLGRLIRFIPYPVIGGFMAGTGWLLMRGSIAVLTDESAVGAAAVGSAWSAVLIVLAPGAVYGLILFIIMKKSGHYLTLPGLIVGGIVFFYMVIFITGTPIEIAQDRGLLLGPFPDTGLWRPVPWRLLADADWGSVLQVMPDIGTIGLLCVISLLLCASSIELEIKRDLDLDRELKTAGAANLAAVLTGGMVGFHGLSLSILPTRMQADSRLVGVIAALFCAVPLLIGASAISYFPRPVLGGLLFFLGLDFTYDWVVDARRRMPLIDYLIVLTILVVVSTIGFLEGIMIGIMAGVIVFVVNYSRVEVVKFSMSGDYYHSNRERPENQRKILQNKGAHIWILKLQSFLFFGTANTLLNRVRKRISAEAPPSLRYLLLDFSAVDGIDSSAVKYFIRMNQTAEAEGFVLCLVSVSERIVSQFEAGGITFDTDGSPYRFTDLDRGMEWCENRILAEENPGGTDRHETLFEIVCREVGDEAAVVFMKYLDRMESREGDFLIRQNEDSTDLYFIETGRVTAVLELEGRQEVRLRTMEAGSVVGEIGFYLGIPRTASIKVEKPSIVYRLTKDSLERMQIQAPRTASAFHEFMVRLTSKRLAESLHIIKHIMA